MKIKVTPLDIRQKVFERALRGYNREEVAAFLLSLSREWESMQEEVRDLRIKLTAREREIAKLREVEESLFKTLKTAENTGANVVEQAHKEAELYLKEARVKAETMQRTAEGRARNKVEESQGVARRIISDMEGKLREAAQNYRTVDQARNELVIKLKQTADELLDRVDQIREKILHFNVDQYLSTAEQTARGTLEIDAPPQQRTYDRERRYERERTRSGGEPPHAARSFFDEIQ